MPITTLVLGLRNNIDETFASNQQNRRQNNWSGRVDLSSSCNCSKVSLLPPLPLCSSLPMPPQEWVGSSPTMSEHGL